MASTTSGDVLPTGARIFISVPDLFFIPEWVIGGLVWILVASTRVVPENPLGWVMFVSIFCFIGTTLWLLIFACGGNQSSFWPGLDAGFHFVAAVFYLSASVVLAYITIVYKTASVIDITLLKIYRLDISAVVMSHVATLLYFLHAIFSAIRWKRA
ncbi:PREDICTED: myelin and lymphocyte protein-like [Poecilia mexicana]|uniref:Myelin and lymphocyte protein n=1 Tax=Poecilia mexicana TaxID=48701 RepID=A0A3B3Z4U1_9TELE|nr:PREDICTED: myelin and lymphocyte protein-like isoform X2 [Poecilia formosa]XP_014856945.1 PREDICTED: myelin and lymphocyte protein-like [Poecilia mexicana]